MDTDTVPLPSFTLPPQHLHLTALSLVTLSVTDFLNQLLVAVVLLGYKRVKGVGVVWYHTPISLHMDWRTHRIPKFQDL